MVIPGERVCPLTIGVRTFFGEHPRLWGELLAFASMSTGTVLAAFLMFQKWFVQSMATSGIKGSARRSLCTRSIPVGDDDSTPGG